MDDELDLMSKTVKKRDIAIRTNVEAVNTRLSVSGNKGFHFD